MRRSLKLSLTESTVDRIEGSKNPETCVLCAGEYGRQFVNGVKVSLPSERQPPGLDSILGIIISKGAKFDILSRLVV